MVFDERITIPYISEGRYDLVFLVRVLFAADASFGRGALELPHSTPFFEQNERMRGGRFRVRSVLHPVPFFCNAELLSFLRFA